MVFANFLLLAPTSPRYNTTTTNNNFRPNSLLFSSGGAPAADERFSVIDMRENHLLTQPYASGFSSTRRLSPPVQYPTPIPTPVQPQQHPPPFRASTMSDGTFPPPHSPLPSSIFDFFLTRNSFPTKFLSPPQF